MGTLRSVAIVTFGAAVIATALFVLFQQTPSTPLDAVIKKTLPKTCAVHSEMHEGLEQSDTAVLQKLAEYERLCQGAVVDSLMLFTPMPVTSTEAENFSSTLAQSLKEFTRFQITPLVIFEPSESDDSILLTIDSGQYDAILRQYYQNLKQHNITDAMMGTWVLFPEANTPAWPHSSPELFVKNTIRVANIQKNVFPSSKLSILLDAHTYPANDASWSDGEIRSLAPYLTSLPGGLIDSFGLQGFPYIPPKNTDQSGARTTSEQFLPIRLAVEAAQTLGVNKLWFNTGTFRVMYAHDSQANVLLTSEQREAILNNVVEQVKHLQATSFTITVNLFAEDKSTLPEGVDWSYLGHELSSDNSTAGVFDRFVRRLRAIDVLFSLYDSIR